MRLILLELALPNNFCLPGIAEKRPSAWYKAIFSMIESADILIFNSREFAV